MSTSACYPATLRAVKVRLPHVVGNQTQLEDFKAAFGSV